MFHRRIVLVLIASLMHSVCAMSPNALTRKPKDPYAELITLVDKYKFMEDDRIIMEKRFIFRTYDENLDKTTYWEWQNEGCEPGFYAVAINTAAYGTSHGQKKIECVVINPEERVWALDNRVWYFVQPDNPTKSTYVRGYWMQESLN